MGKIPPRFLTVSYTIPVRTSGTPVVVRKFLENFTTDEVALIGRPPGKLGNISNYAFEYPVYQIPTFSFETRGERLWRLLSVLPGIVRGLQVIKKFGPQAILAFYPDEGSLMTGYFLRGITRLPFYPYFCDLYLENYSSGISAKVARWLQPRVLKEADKTLVLTQGMADYFSNRYRVEPIVLRHCVNVPAPVLESLPEVSTPLRIGYLGNVNIDRLEYLRMLTAVINNNSNDFQLSYFTPQSRQILEKMGVLPPNSTVNFIPDDNLLLKELKSCDIFFLPIVPSCDSEREQQSVTGFPTKLLDYFLSQRPVLVHCPAAYYTALFCRKYGCGYVVDGGADDVLSALRKLRDEKELRFDLVQNGLRAISIFDGVEIANRFRDLLTS